jgi:hypothetical protein
MAKDGEQLRTLNLLFSVFLKGTSLAGWLWWYLCAGNCNLYRESRENICRYGAARNRVASVERT